MIPLSKPSIGEEEILAVTEVLNSNRLTLGPKIKEFEKRFARLIGTKYAIAVNSGTAGLHLCIKSLDIKPGDEIITTPFSFVSSANCILFEKAKPVFVDVEEDSFNINPNLIEDKISERTKAILPVHIFGQSCDMDKIIKIAKKHNLKIIEDSCESILATYKEKNVGTFGDASVFSFYPNKQMTTGEGGMIVTNNENIYNLCKSFHNQGRNNNTQWLTHERLGYNYRMGEMSAAVGVEQIKKLPSFIKKRRELARLYIKELTYIEGVTVPTTKKENEHSWFVFPIQVKEQNRDFIIEKLNEAGIQSKAYFYPCIHLQPFYRADYGYKEGDFPIAEKLSKTTIILPFFEQMKKVEMDIIVKSLKKILNSLGN